MPFLAFLIRIVRFLVSRGQRRLESIRLEKLYVYYFARPIDPTLISRGSVCKTICGTIQNALFIFAIREKIEGRFSIGPSVRLILQQLVGSTMFEHKHYALSCTQVVAIERRRSILPRKRSTLRATIIVLGFRLNLYGLKSVVRS